MSDATNNIVPPHTAWLWDPVGSQASADALPARHSIGGKAHQLATLHALAARHGARVPRFIVLRAEAWERFRESTDPHAPLPDELARTISEALRASALANATLAVRSSATLEDGATASFAGQFDTVLGVPAHDAPALHAAIRRVWSSTEGAHAIAYRRQQPASELRMAVILQELAEPVSAGVAFALDPVTHDADTTVVSAVYGLGEGLVSGELDADTWHIPRAPGGAVRYTPGTKSHAVRGVSGGGTRLDVLPASLQNTPVLNDAELLQLAHMVRGISAALGAPQDMEWAFVESAGAATRELVLLQTRPITAIGAPSGAIAGAVAGTVAGTVAGATAGTSTDVSTSPPPAPPAPNDPRGPGRRVWDNANIIESYAGVTTPLTFTFARSVYEDVYRQFCRLMGVDEALIAANDSTFAHMLGLVRGRVYYSLINWYRLIALLPGFAWNRSFMERMMGVREALEAPPPPPSSGSRWRDLTRLLRMLARMIRAHGALGREVPAFHARVDASLAPLRATSLSEWKAPRIATLYRDLEQKLLHHWRPPLVNDFFAMVFFGVQGRLITQWLPESAPTLGNDLLCGEGGIISTEPARRVMALARRVQETPAWRAAFDETPDDHALWERLMSDDHMRPLAEQLRQYVDMFGDRCLEELKLETITLREDPTFLVRMVRAYVEQGSLDPDAALAHEQRVRREAETHVRSTLRGWRAPVFFWVVRKTRARVRDRENLRFERTRVFGIVRRMMLGLGAAYVREGWLREDRDIFWLTIEEALALAEGTSAPADPAALVAERRTVFAAWQGDAAPPDRFETRGPLGDWEGPREAEIPRLAAMQAQEGDLTGTGCCPGVVRAPVRIVRDPREAVALGGCILVAERTDPGWTLLFPAAAGLLVQRGSLLSHSAIVAREMALPCVVGIPGLLETLVDGEVVEMDGTTGIVRRLASAPDE